MWIASLYLGCVMSVLVLIDCNPDEQRDYVFNAWQIVWVSSLLFVNRMLKLMHCRPQHLCHLDVILGVAITVPGLLCLTKTLAAPSDERVAGCWLEHPLRFLTFIVGIAFTSSVCTYLTYLLVTCACRRQKQQPLLDLRSPPQQYLSL